MITAGSNYKVSVEKMYQELLIFSKISHWSHIKSVTTEERYFCELNKSLQLSFCSPDQVVLFEDMDNDDGGMITGIDFETALNLLEPHMRKLKIDKLKDNIK